MRFWLVSMVSAEVTKSLPFATVTAAAPPAALTASGRLHPTAALASRVSRQSPLQMAGPSPLRHPVAQHRYRLRDLSGTVPREPQRPNDSRADRPLGRPHRGRHCCATPTERSGDHRRISAVRRIDVRSSGDDRSEVTAWLDDELDGGAVEALVAGETAGAGRWCIAAFVRRVRSVGDRRPPRCRRLAPRRGDRHATQRRRGHRVGRCRRRG